MGSLLRQGAALRPFERQVERSLCPFVDLEYRCTQDTDRLRRVYVVVEKVPEGDGRSLLSRGVRKIRRRPSSGDGREDEARKRGT